MINIPLLSSYTTFALTVFTGITLAVQNIKLLNLMTIGGMYDRVSLWLQ